MSDELQVLYVGGYGRSGSTLLERLLGASDAVEALGELYKIPRQFSDERTHCGCRKPVHNCSLWGDVLDRLDLIEKKLSPGYVPYTDERSDEPDESWPWPDRKQYRSFHERLFGSIRETIEDSVRYITDISKTTLDASLRPVLLDQCRNVSVRMIHLTRDSRACLWSKYKRDRRKQKQSADKRRSWFSRLRSNPILRTNVHWLFANLAAQSFRLRSPSDYIRVSYEELTNQPLSLLDRLERFLDEDLSRSKQLVRNDKPIPNAHQIDGNRLRLQDGIRLHPDKQSWKQNLTTTQKALHELLGGFLIHFYGY